MTATTENVGPPNDPRDDDPGLAPIGCAALGAAALGLPALAAAMGLCYFLIGLQVKDISPIDLFTTGCMRMWWWLYVVPALIGLGLGAVGYNVAARSGQAAVKWAMRPALVWVAVFGLIVTAMLLATSVGK